MSLFPAYSDSSERKDGPVIKTPSWLTNTSFKDFQENISSSNDKVRVLTSKEDFSVEISSDSDLEDPLKSTQSNAIVISSDDRESETFEKHKIKKKKKDKKSKYNKVKSNRDSSRSRSRSRSYERRRSRSRSRSRHKNKRKEKRTRGSMSRSRSGDKHRRRISRSYSRSPRRRKNRSRSRSRKRSGETPLITAKMSNKIFIEEVGVNWKGAFREDRKGDRTNLGGTGLYSRDVAKYKKKIRIPLGEDIKSFNQKEINRNPRFHDKQYVRQVKKAKDVQRITKSSVKREKQEIDFDCRQSYLSVETHSDEADIHKQKEKQLNPLGIYSSETVDYLSGVGGLSKEEETVFENDDIELRRIDFNTKLREQPHNIQLWLEFIDFQDDALKEKVFESNDEKESKKSRKKNGEILRAKALVERKLAICKSAIEKNTRSIELAVKRLELSRDLFDSKTLDQQWKELIFVYPENLELWKRYLLFVQTHYIRFSVTDTIKAYKGCVQKLKSALEKGMHEGEAASRLLEAEHGILDIVEAGARLWLQSGHSEKAVALYQALIEFNLFSPDFDSSGNYTVDDRLSLFEPIWDSGVRKVGQAGARGWGVELQQRIGEAEAMVEEDLVKTDTDFEDNLIAGAEDGGDKGSIWLQIEGHRDQTYFFPWRKGEEDPEDPERIVDFDTVLGFLVLFSSQEAKFRLLLSLLHILGFQETAQPFSNLVNSEASSILFNMTGRVQEDFDESTVLNRITPSYRTKESLAIFCHYLFAQTYHKFREPFRTKIILMWLDFEREIVKVNKEDVGMRKDLKKLVKSLLKEDRNNVELVSKFIEIECDLAGYDTAYNILTTSMSAFNKNFLIQGDEDSRVSSLVLVRTGIEMELREIVSLASRGDSAQHRERDALHKDRLQWLLVMSASDKFRPMTSDNKHSMVALVGNVMDKYSEWIPENIEKVAKIKFSTLAPSVKHSLVEVLFIFGWLVKFSAGWKESCDMLHNYSYQLSNKIASRIRNKNRFNDEYLTIKFIQESVDKICFDIMWFETVFDVQVKQNLRNFYIKCVKTHPHNEYFVKKLGDVEDSNSVVSSVWREVVSIVKDKGKLVNIVLVEEVLRIGILKFVRVLDPGRPGDLPCIGLGFLNKLHNLLGFLVTLPGVRHNPLAWRLYIWTTSILHSDIESLKTILYRAIQDVAWCKALYMDTGLYLNKIGQLYCTTRKQVTYTGTTEDIEDEEELEPKYEEIPGTLEHVTELMVEKDLRLRLPLQELDVLLEPVI